jgi:hypothetical protein
VAGDTRDLLCRDRPRAEALRRARADTDALSASSQTARALADPTRLMVAPAPPGWSVPAETATA